MPYRPRSKSRDFFSPWSRHESNAFLEGLAQRFASQSGPFEEQLTQLLQSNSLGGIANHSIKYDPKHYPHHLVNARRCLALFSKNSDLQLGIDKEEVAWNTFAMTEIKCKATNSRFLDYSLGINSDPDVESIILMAQHKIATILGDVPKLQDLRLGFGPGASTTCKRKTSARRKLTTVPVCSSDAAPHIFELRDTILPYFLHHSDVVRIGPGELSFVPKSAKTDRSIMIEPILNTFVQRGIGRHIKKRLQSFGYNLYDQGLNRSRAQEGSITGLLGTIDLSSASDLIAKEVVATLLPDEWLTLLCAWRTSDIVYKKKNLRFRLEKFSSMGNGFTFELESLIFMALADAACRQMGITPDVSVYGDDLIVPVGSYDRICEVLEKFGFLVNREKSYGSGPFRESCGGDYFFGVDIRPFYCKGRWTDARAIALHNHLVRSGFDDRDTRQYIISHICPRNLLMGPDGYGDGHLVTPFRGEAYRWSEGWQGFVFKSFAKRPLSDSSAPLTGDYLLPAYTAYQNEGKTESTDVDFDPLVLRGGERSKIVRIYILE